MSVPARAPVATFSPRRTLPAACSAGTRRVLAVVPAHDEAASLPGVLSDLHACCPDVRVLVVDDGSRDGTWRVAERAGARWLRFDERLGVGCAVKAGIRYALHHGADAVVRLDGDGQHAAADAVRLVARVTEGDVDVVLGSRRVDGRFPTGSLSRRLAQRTLAWLLSRITGHPVTDPTCGCSAFGPRALALLADEHPSGYPEPELRLLFARARLRVVEVTIEARPRTAGRSTLTTARVWLAAARVVLAMIVVPFRRMAGTVADGELPGRHAGTAAGPAVGAVLRMTDGD